MTEVAGRRADTGFLPVLPTRFALLELAVFAAIIACEYWIEPFPDLTRLNPHPYWIAILLLSLQYGTVSGLLAAALAIGGTVLMGLPEAEIGEAYFAYLVRVWTQPVLWIVVALLLGSFRMRQIEERDNLRRQVDDATAQSSALFGYSNKLKDRVDRLERELAVTAAPQASTLLDTLAKLGAAASAEQRATMARAAIGLVVPGADISVLSLNRDQFETVLQVGAARATKDVRLDTPLAQAILSQGRTLSVLDAADDRVLSGMAKVVVPIPGPDGRLAGLLRIDAIDAVALDARLLRRLDAFARHLTPLVGSTAAASVATPSVVPFLRRIRSGRRAEQATAGGTLGMATARPPIEPKG